MKNVNVDFRMSSLTEPNDEIRRTINYSSIKQLFQSFPMNLIDLQRSLSNSSGSISNSQPLPRGLVSIITPTEGREVLHKFLYQSFQHQTYPEKELLILDTSQAPSSFFSQLNDSRVRYFHQPGLKIPLGAKIEELIKMAQGEFVARFDDDDYYGPRYLETMIDYMIREGADFVKLDGWFTYMEVDGHFFYWHAKQASNPTFRLIPGSPLEYWGARSPVEEDYMGYGFSQVFRRNITNVVSHPHKDWAEDYAFIHGVMKANFSVKTFPDEQGIFMFIKRKRYSRSVVWAGYLLPEFLIEHLFGKDFRIQEYLV
jgi:glycosyltransferase involved in cell wall biosynthesis